MTPPRVSASSVPDVSATPPRLAGTAGASVSPGSKYAPTGFGNVLIVDRDAPTRRALGAWLADRRYFVAFADSPEVASVTLGTIGFDLIICDSTARSLAARRWIERLLLRPPCPVIFLTAHPTLETAIRVANLPVAGYLTKPVDFAALEPLLARIFAQASPPAAASPGPAQAPAGQKSAAAPAPFAPPLRP